jgi:hypothetical protein
MLEQEREVLRGIAERMTKLHRVRDGILRRVAKGDNPVFAELAREVRAGRMTLQEAAASYAYREHVAQAADRVVERLSTLTKEELEALSVGRTVDDALAELEAEEAAEDAEAAARRQPIRPEPQDTTDYDAPIMTAPKVDRNEDPGGPQRTRWNRRWK